MLRWKPNRKPLFDKCLTLMPRYYDAHCAINGKEAAGLTMDGMLSSTDILTAMDHGFRGPEMLGEVLPPIFADFEFSDVSDRQRVTALRGIQIEQDGWTITNMCVTDHTYYLLRSIAHLGGENWRQITLLNNAGTFIKQMAFLGLSVNQQPTRIQMIVTATEGPSHGVTWKYLYRNMREVLR